MHWLLERIEKRVDDLIPYALLVLLVIVILEFTINTARYDKLIQIIDDIILGIFTLDLCFKYYRIKTTALFFRTYWLELIAVFPFYLLIRAYTALIELSRGVEETQKVLHEAALIKEARFLEEGKVLREARVVEEEARLLRESSTLMRTVRLIQKMLRLLYARMVFAKNLLFHVRKKKRVK